jgi:hypothetical protein
MTGAITGDYIGSAYEFENTRDYNFPFITSESSIIVLPIQYRTRILAISNHLFTVMTVIYLIDAISLKTFACSTSF